MRKHVDPAFPDTEDGLSVLRKRMQTRRDDNGDGVFFKSKVYREAMPKDMEKAAEDVHARCHCHCDRHWLPPRPPPPQSPTPPPPPHHRHHSQHPRGYEYRRFQLCCEFLRGRPTVTSDPPPSSRQSSDAILRCSCRVVIVPLPRRSKIPAIVQRRRRKNHRIMRRRWQLLKQRIRKRSSRCAVVTLLSLSLRRRKERLVVLGRALPRTA